jgi:hypothetical protein
MRKIWFYFVAAMAVMFTLPATAADGWEGFAPAYSEATPALAVTDDSPMLAERSAMRQLEAADLYLATKVTSSTQITGWNSPAQWPDGSGAVHEAGWRS